MYVMTLMFWKLCWYCLESDCRNDNPFVSETIPDALQTGCEKCNEKQKTTSERVMKHLMKERTKDWERLLNKYDPKGEYKKKYASLAQGAITKPWRVASCVTGQKKHNELFPVQHCFNAEVLLINSFRNVQQICNG